LGVGSVRAFRTRTGFKEAFLILTGNHFGNMATTPFERVPVGCPTHDSGSSDNKTDSVFNLDMVRNATWDNPRIA
jgi:hypothetical protein